VDPAVTRQLGAAHPLAQHLSDFLTDLGNANASAHTIRAHRGDLLQFAAHHDGEIGDLSAGPVRAYLAAKACGLYVEDLDLRLDDEHVRNHGKGGTVRTVLLDEQRAATPNQSGWRPRSASL
jgi:hypothetical protein